MLVSEQLADEVTAWIREQVREAGCEGVVVGISGGVDSAVAAALAQRGLGRGAVLGLIMPCHSGSNDEEHARLVVNTFGIRVERVDLTPDSLAIVELRADGAGPPQLVAEHRLQLDGRPLRVDPADHPEQERG